MSRLSVALAGETDLAGFREAARRLLQAGCAPDEVTWQVAAAPGEPALADLLAEPPLSVAELCALLPPGGGAPSVPPWFIGLLGSAGLHVASDRFARLYRLLWRLQREPTLRHDELDPERVHLQRLARQVGREIHKMHAFVRFRPVSEAVAGEAALTRTLHLAWFVPEHHVVEAAADFFRRRFAIMRWAILTPRRSVAWDGQALRFGPGAQPEDAPAPDAGEALWLTYYQHTFNPARLNLAQMAREMPRRYWAQLPEAVLIRPLADGALERQGRMLGHMPR